jgi:hypothetical protein
MLWILAAILGLITALWGIAHHLKDAAPPPVCTEHRCECAGFDHGRAGE